MRLLIWGAGAIGGTLGAYLIQAGHDITFVDRAADHVAAINQKGTHHHRPDCRVHRAGHRLHANDPPRPMGNCVALRQGPGHSRRGPGSSHPASARTALSSRFRMG